MSSSSSRDVKELRRLIDARVACIAIGTHEEAYARDVVIAAAVEAQVPLVTWSISRGVEEDAFHHLEQGSEIAPSHLKPDEGLTVVRQRGGERVIALFHDLAPHLGEAIVHRLLRDLVTNFENEGSTLILIDHVEQLPGPIESVASRVELSLPDEGEVDELVRATIRHEHARSPVDIELRRSDLANLNSNLLGLTRQQVRRVLRDCMVDDRRLDAADLDRVIALKQRILAAEGLLEFVDAKPGLHVGGLRRLKHWLRQRHRAFRGDARELGVDSPRGVLVVGVQGAGKSLCAKAVAAAWRVPLLRMDPGVLYDRYIGESERRLRLALHQVERMSPAVLWIDEIEKGFASSSNTSSDGGLSRRMFGTLLTWMQEHRSTTFLFATANEIDALPPELVRKGRFDEIFFVDLPTEEARQQIWKIHLERRKQDPAAFDMRRLVAQSEGYSGSEIEQAVISALYLAMERERGLDDQCIIDALVGSPPISVTMRERVDTVRAWAAGRCVPAD